MELEEEGEEKLIMPRRERARKFGIDCVDILDWKAGSWEPGGEYVQKLILKNVSTTTLKLKYQIPETKFFSMEFPQLITLSPGTFIPVDVVFRPIHYEPYDDVVIIHSPAGDFAVRVRALVSTLRVAVPDALDFGFVPTGETTSKMIQVRNVGQVSAKFSWRHGPPSCSNPSRDRSSPEKACPSRYRWHRQMLLSSYPLPSARSQAQNRFS